ncbi:MAG: radical SAM/SPASM domain protein, ACGX system [Clostridiales bacterium]|nr:radical SAM/SPASM domain protein, ACGX system [Clostridiales bacterium]
MQLHITDKCDQRCKHCYIYRGRNKCIKEDMPIDTLYEIVADFKDCCSKMYRTPFITLTGGDPLLYKDIWKFLSFLYKKNIKFAILGNPYHLTDEVAEKLKNYGCVNYQMSLDGMRKVHDNIRNKIGSFNETLKKISCLKKAGIPVTIMTTVSKTNIETIPKLVDMVVQYKVDYFSFARYCPDYKGINNIVSPEEYREFLEKMWNKFEQHKKSKTKFMLKDHLWNLFLYEKGYLNLDEIRNENNLILDGCHCGISHITVLSDGTVYACRRCESPVGNVPKQSIYDIFFGEKMNSYRQYDNFDECSKCKLRNICRGCPAVAKSVTGNFYAKDPQCWRTVIEEENNETSAKE